jgi:dimethylamine/trimethylamine dehydrogenase
VTVATPYEQLAPLCYETLEAGQVWRRMHELGISLATATTLTALEPDHTLGHDPLGSPITLEADAVVLVTQRVSDETLYTELTSEQPPSPRTTGTKAVYRIGDCVSPRLLGDVIFDGHRLAREIDSPNPSVALPYLRERPFDAAAATTSAL